MIASSLPLYAASRSTDAKAMAALSADTSGELPARRVPRGIHV